MPHVRKMEEKDLQKAADLHQKERMPLKRIGERFGVNPSYLRRLFKERGFEVSKGLRSWD